MRAQRLEHAAGDVRAGRDRASRCGRRTEPWLRNSQLLSTSNAAQPPSLDLHRQQPVDARVSRRPAAPSGPTPRAAAQRQQHHRRVVDVRIKLVGEFEIPAGRLGIRPLDAPVALAPDLPPEQPVRRGPARRYSRARSAQGIAPIAVSQTGEKHGWKKKRSPSSTIRRLNWRTLRRAPDDRWIPKRSSAMTAYIMGG